VVKKSVTATLDLAAVAAYAARVFKPFEDRLPGFSDSCLAVARKAWDWARANPTAYYRQTEMNLTHVPAIVTGEYGDGNAGDEFQWAGVELYLTTRIDSFYTAAYPTSLPTRISTPSWGGVGALAFYSMAEAVGPQGGAPEGLAKLEPEAIRLRLREAATALTTVVGASALQVPMAVTRDFNWGSNSNSGNMGMLLIQAWRATGEAAFLKAAVDALDYLLGRNGPSLSFVTGFGARSPQNPHHRPSEADGIAEPVPGFLVGGPNATGKQSDGCVYPSALPALSYSDTQCSYASNEVTINWNAPLAYLSGALHVLYSGTGGTSIQGGVRPGSAKAGPGRARLTWGADGPLLVLPKGVKASVDFFDGQGRIWSAARLRDSARVGEKRPGLLFYRLRVDAGAGRKEVLHTGSWATVSHLAIAL
jgi:endoglucanase